MAIPIGLHCNHQLRVIIGMYMAGELFVILLFGDRLEPSQCENVLDIENVHEFPLYGHFEGSPKRFTD